MRGKATIFQSHLGNTRITPAYAGKSTETIMVCKKCWDHPRLCGEKQHATAVADAVGGSPPPMRGKVPAVVELNLPIGITPAYAGKSPVWTHRTPSCQDHPRLCGEKKALDRADDRKKGSPPPMRGKVFQKCPIKIAAGITPAYAGKSPSHLDFPFAQRDHPRLCGEKVWLTVRLLS